MRLRDIQLAPPNRSGRQPCVPISLPPLTDAESSFLKDSHGNEFKFLRAYGLSIHDNEKRAEGRNLLKGFISGTERGRNGNIDHDAPAHVGIRYPNHPDQNSELHTTDQRTFQQEFRVSDHQYHHPAFSQRFYQHEPVISEDQYPDGTELDSSFGSESDMTQHRYRHPSVFEQHFFEQESEVPGDRCHHGSHFESPYAAAYDEGREYADDPESAPISRTVGHIQNEPALSPNESHHYDRGECGGMAKPASSQSREDSGSDHDELYAGDSCNEDELNDAFYDGEGDDYNYD